MTVGRAPRGPIAGGFGGAVVGWLALVGCGPAPEVTPSGGALVFLRGAVLAPAGADGGHATPAGVVVSRAWSAGEAVTVGGALGVAPAQPECVPLFSVPLGDVSRLVSMGGADPDTVLAFSPDGSALAIGTYLGEVVVVDGWTGAVRARRALSEAMVKTLAWSSDGRWLFAGEQSPDASVLRLDPATLDGASLVRMADHVGAGTPPAGDDLYGVYTLPAVTGLEPLPDGDVIVVAAHAWTDGAGVRRNASKVVRVRPDGAVAAQFPASGAASASFLRPVVDPGGAAIAFGVWRSAEGSPTADEAAIALVLRPDLTLWRRLEIEPLSPHFQRASVWEALAVRAAEGRVFAGLADGRAAWLSLETGGVTSVMGPATPIQLGEVAIHATIGAGVVVGGAGVVVTSRTQIPWGSAAPEVRPPSLHPNENAVIGYDHAGVEQFRMTGPWELAGATALPDGSALVVSAGARASDQRTDAFGAVIVPLDPPYDFVDRTVVCRTEGPAYFRHAVTADGRVAVTELPYKGADGSIHASYRATVVR